MLLWNKEVVILNMSERLQERCLKHIEMYRPTVTLNNVLGSSLRFTLVTTRPDSSSTSKILALYGNRTTSTLYRTWLAGVPYEKKCIF